MLLKGGAVFLHVPKTGGTWARKVLAANGLVVRSFGHEHADYAHARAYWRRYPDHAAQLLLHRAPLLPLAGDPFVFCFVRHPLSWIESWWSFVSSLGWPRFSERQSRLRGWHPTQRLESFSPSVHGPSFGDFANYMAAEAAGFVSEMFAGYTRGATFVGKLEDAASDLARALDLAGLALPPGSISAVAPSNVSRTVDVRYEWPASARAAILRAEQPALEAYGYGEELD